MLKLGTNSISSIYLGSTKIAKAYLGTNLVYQAGGGAVVPLQVTATKNHGMDLNGNIVSGTASLFYTTTIPVKAGQVVSFLCRQATSYAAIFYYINGVFGAGAPGKSTRRWDTVTWTATADCEVGFSSYDYIGNTPTATVDDQPVEILGL